MLGEELEVLDLFRNWTPEMIEAMKSHRGGNRRLGRTKEELDEWDRRISEGAKAGWDRKTPEEMVEFRKTCSEVRSKKTPEEQLEWTRKSAEGSRETWANKTPEQMDEFRNMVRDTWANRTQEERDAISDKISKTVKDIWDTKPEVYGEERNRKVGEASRRWWASKTPEEMEESNKRKSELQTTAWARLTQEERDRWAKNCLEGQKRKPSMPEFFLGVYLERNLPGKYEYTGDGKAGFTIGGKTPDFIRRDGKKEVIEVLGAIGYYHSLEDENKKLAHYKEYGYGCIVVFEWDCYLPGELDKIFKERSKSDA